MTDPNRRAELIAAAVDDSLTDSERAELDALRRRDHSIDREIVELREVVARMIAATPTATWDGSMPDASLRERVVGLADAAPSAGRPIPRRRGWLLGVAAAACVLVGVGGTLGVQAAGSRPVTGPPGTLGAVERVDFSGEAGDVVVDGALVAHTWGTETMLEIDGLTSDDRYSVIVIARDGSRVDSGSFLGSPVTIDCRLNASVPRADVASVEIQDDTGAVVAAASVPSTI